MTQLIPKRAFTASQGAGVPRPSCPTPTRIPPPVSSAQRGCRFESPEALYKVSASVKCRFWRWERAPGCFKQLAGDAAVFRAHETTSRVHGGSPPPARGSAAARLSVGLVVATVTPRLLPGLISACSHAGFLTPT